MEIEQVPVKKDINKQTTFLKKIDLETFKLLTSIKDKANKKSIGRKVRDSEVLLAALRLIGAQQIKELQATTYSEKDRLALAHEEYQKLNGKVSLEQFINKLLSSAPSSKSN
jgi:hypothetical protein